jgi:hypothetical protein
MQTIRRILTIGTLALAACGWLAASAAAQSVAGMWDATVTVNGVAVPFRFEIAGAGQNVKGSFFNGDDRTTSTSGRIDKGDLTLNFDQLGTKVEATLAGDALDGQYLRGGSRAPYPFHAVRFTPPPPVTGKVPSIAGLWTSRSTAAKAKRRGGSSCARRAPTCRPPSCAWTAIPARSSAGSRTAASRSATSRARGRS